MRRSLKFLLGAFGFIVILGIIFTGWGLSPSKPMPEALVAIRSDNRISVQSGEWLVFTPTEGQIETGLIIYPGGHVDFRAYAPVAKEIAAKGNLVVIVPMPLNLAVLNSEAALKVITSFPEIKHWAVGGHSLGGAMAAHFIFQHPGKVEGLILWASYSASNEDLSDFGINVLSISASLDGLTTPDKIADSRLRLPDDTTWVTITGGNHAQFGWYGDQSGDNPSSITRLEQLDQVVSASAEFLSMLR